MDNDTNDSYFRHKGIIITDIPHEIRDMLATWREFIHGRSEMKPTTILPTVFDIPMILKRNHNPISLVFGSQGFVFLLSVGFKLMLS